MAGSRTPQSRKALTRIATLAVITAISSILLVVTIPFPLFPAFKYDFADIPIFIATFAFGPVAGLIVTAVASAIQAFIMGQDSWMGFAMHMIATGTFVIVAGIIYSRNKTRKRALIALIAGTLSMTAVMCVANYVLDPLLYGMQKEAVAKLIVPAIIPFNLTKAGINSAITFLVYKRISNLIHRLENR